MKIIYILLICVCIYITIHNYYNMMKSKIHYNTHLINLIALNSQIKNLDIPIFYINLDRSPGRNAYMIAQFKTLKMNDYYRVRGIDGKQFTNIKFGKITNGENTSLIPLSKEVTYQNNYNLSNSELGCLLSHIKAINMAYDMKMPYALIMEDDCYIELSVLWKKKLTDIINNLQVEWGIIKFQFPFVKHSHKLSYKKYSMSDRWKMATAYIISSRGMKNIIDNTGYPSIILGQYKNGEKWPKWGEADSYLFDLTPTYIVNQSYIIPNNINLESLLHPLHSPYHLYNTNVFLNTFLDNFFIK